MVQFSDEAGNRPSIVAPFFAWRLHSGPLEIREGCGGLNTLDAMMWAATLDASVEIEPLLAVGGGDADRHEACPLQGSGPTAAIEIWTETELSAMHALFWLVILRNEPKWVGRLDAAVRWHVEFLQPDNATNRPWAIHVFADHAIRHGNIGARLHAETLLHNCQVQLGRPDRLSGEILRDAADALERLTMASGKIA